MNYIRHLTGFFERVAKDRLLNPSHIALYIAIFQFWNLNRFRNPISISRDELMRISKISSKATYHKCLKLLHAHGYLKYEPSYNPYRGSHVIMFNFAEDLRPDTKKPETAPPIFSPANEQAVNKQRTSSEQLDEQALVPSINNINITNNQNDANEETPTQKFDDENLALDVGAKRKEEKSSAKKEEREKEMPQPFIEPETGFQSAAFAGSDENQINTSRQKKLREKKKEDFPSLDEVVVFFESEQFPNPEAHKFFNYYQSIGWLVGGKAPMLDWQAAAKNWMLNAPKYETHDTVTPSPVRQLDTSPGKNYAEPL